MEFALSEEQRLFADSLRDLLTDRVTIDSLRRHADAGTGFDPALWDALTQLGLPGPLVPERFGGAGLGVLDAAVAAEAFGGAAAYAPFAGSIVMATLAFIHGATEAQQDEFLPRIAAGEIRFGVGISQDGSTAAAALDSGAPTHLLVCILPDGTAAVARRRCRHRHPPQRASTARAPSPTSGLQPGQRHHPERRQCAPSPPCTACWMPAASCSQPIRSAPPSTCSTPPSPS